MTDSPHDVTAEQLGRQGDFLRGLARSLVTDEHEADDLVQETWLRALKGGAAERPRSWFRSVLLNLTREGFRKGRRRERRERVAASAEELPSHDQMVERLEVNHRLAMAVLDLPEPYRSTVHLHFFEQRSLREIAAQTGVPWETVRSRLKRGLSYLRLRLDRDAGGDRARWMAALVPLAEGSWQSVAVAGGAAAVTGVGAWTMGATAAVVTIGVGAWVWFGTGGPEEPVEPAGASKVTAVDPVAANRSPATLPPAPTTTEPPATSQDEDGRIEITGHFTVIDRQGGVHDAESGEFLLIWVVEGQPHRETVPVTAGRFQHRIHPSTMLGAWQVTLGGRYARLESRQLAYTAGQPLEIRAFWQPPVTFQVYDAASGAPLDGAEVVMRRGWRAMGVDEHPGENAQLVTMFQDAATPVKLSGEESLKVYWVRAPGYAWYRIDVDHDVGGVYRAGLVPGAAVDVTIEGDFERYNTFLRLRQPDQELHRWVVEVPAPTGSTRRIEGLKPGEYELSLDLGEFLDSDRLATLDVELTAGGTTTAKLVLDPERVERVMAPLAGTLVLPPEARAMDTMPVSVVVELVESEDGRPQSRAIINFASMHELQRDHYRFDAGSLTPGVYVATVAGLQYRKKFRLREDGMADLRLEVPPLREVRVVVLDASGQPVQADKVGWSSVNPPGVWFGTRRDARYDDDTSEYWFVAPLGDYRVGVSDPRFASQDRHFRVTEEGPNRLDFPAQTVHSVMVRLVENGVVVTAPSEWWQRVQVTGDHLLTGMSTTYASGTFKVKKPGEYVVLFPKLKGYADIERQVVQVKAGQDNLLEVPVRRSQ